MGRRLLSEIVLLEVDERRIARSFLARALGGNRNVLGTRVLPPAADS